MANEIYDDIDIYADTLIFTKQRNKDDFVYKEEYSGSDFKLPLFHCPFRDYWYSFVSIDQMKFTHSIKLTIENFCYWLRAAPFQHDTFKSWQNEYKIVLKLHFVDMEKNYQNQLSIRGSAPVYNPTWEPKNVVHLGIEDEHFTHVFLFNYKAKTKCGMPNCRFSTQRRDKLKRHRDSCKDTSEIVCKKKCYGLEEPVIDDLAFDDSFLEDPNFKFAVYDLETTEIASDVAEAQCRILSIGLYSNIDEKQYYYERQSSATEHGQTMVDQFIERLFALALIFQAGLPPQIIDELERIKEMVSTCAMYHVTMLPCFHVPCAMCHVLKPF